MNTTLARILPVLASASLVSLAAPAEARTSVGISVDLGALVWSFASLSGRGAHHVSVYAPAPQLVFPPPRVVVPHPRVCPPPPVVFRPTFFGPVPVVPGRAGRHCPPPVARYRHHAPPPPFARHRHHAAPPPVARYRPAPPCRTQQRRAPGPPRHGSRRR